MSLYQTRDHYLWSGRGRWRRSAPSARAPPHRERSAATADPWWR